MGADLYLVKLNAEKTYSNNTGYYRDSYNSYNLLWLLGLDYWVWFTSFLSKGGILKPDKAKKILETLTEKKNTLDRLTGFMKEEHSKWFNDKYKELTEFLSKAIELKSDIECSL